MISNFNLLGIISLLKIEQQSIKDIYVHFSDKDSNEIPIKHPFRINSYLIFIIISGEINTQINLLDIFFKRGNIAILPPNTVVHYKEASTEFQQITINFSLDFALNTTIKNKLILANFLIRNDIKLLKTECENLSYITKTAELLLLSNDVKSKNFYLLHDTISNLFSNLLYTIINIDNCDQITPKVKSRKEIIFIDLLKLITNDFRNNRSASYYADKLSISKSYLNKITKELNNKTINQLIEYALITEAQFLLSNPNFTLLEISDFLNFSDQSSFGKYFKKHTGITPLKYRKNNNIE